MSDITLKAHLFLNNLTATASSDWAPVSYGYSGVQHRSIFGKRADKDSQIHVYGKISVPQFDSLGQRLATIIEVTATVTTFTSAAGTNFNCTIETPLTHIRVIKANASGAATIAGII